MDALIESSIKGTVAAAINEDLGDGDITAQLISEHAVAEAELICRDNAVIAGQPWAEAVFAAIDPDVVLDWRISEGGQATPGSPILTCRGSAQSILTAERTAMNFLQTLSATATETAALAQAIRHTKAKLLDTRKTLPGLRLAQKYAVRLGGGENHRIGLFDAFLIKENHIQAAGGIGSAIAAARALSAGKRVEVEVENLGTGSAQANVSASSIKSIKVVAPSSDLKEKFGEVINPIIDRILTAAAEIEVLSKLRDTLLPKLISGELCIPDAEKFLEEAEI